MLQSGIIAAALALMGEASLPEVLPRELTCLATNIYHEARGESLVGQAAVAHVTLNRVEASGFPETVCGVVYQKAQFSWTAAKSLKIHEPIAFKRALFVAFSAHVGLSADPTGGATYYYDHSTVTPSWSRVFKTTAVIGGHTFQRSKG